MGAVQRFIGFGAGAVAMFAALKAIDGALYSMDEARPARIREERLRRDVRRAAAAAAAEAEAAAA
jgi:hypothetical protein